MQFDVPKVPQKINHQLYTIDMPRGVDEPPEVAEFNAEVKQHRAVRSPGDDPLEIESPVAYLNANFLHLRDRGRLHRRRAELLGPGGAAAAAVTDTLERINDARRRVHEQLVTAAVAGDMAGVTDRIKENTADEAFNAVVSSIESWRSRGDNADYNDSQAAQRCEELLREAFDRFTICVDLWPECPEPAETTAGESGQPPRKRRNRSPLALA